MVVSLRVEKLSGKKTAVYNDIEIARRKFISYQETSIYYLDTRHTNRRLRMSYVLTKFLFHNVIMFWGDSKIHIYFVMLNRRI